jgi:uncharacterized protein (DUF1330 family)
MPAYVIIDTKVHEPDKYEKYKALARPLVEKYGGKYLARGGDLEVVDGELWQPTRMVLLEFPDGDAARAFFNSDEYEPVVALRHAYADSTVVIVDGAA